MKFTTGFILLCCIFARSHSQAAQQCKEEDCSIDKNCRCSSTQNPINSTTAPQLVVLAFVEAVTTELYENKWSKLLESRHNPDGSFIGATFYVPHEYTDYQRVQDLASIGFEVAVRSISNEPYQEYWREANVTLLEQEFGGQRKIISKFANIDENYITGVMTPQFQLAGDNSMKAFVQQGFKYDSSWPSKTAFLPYTLDYASTQSCDVGNSCPKESHPGFWEAPIIDLVGEDDLCATIAACFRKRQNQTKEEISDWLYQQVDRQRQGSRAPVILVIESTWFDNVENSWDGLVDALDRLEKLSDLYFVTQGRVIKWLKNPVPLSEFKTDLVELSGGCTEFTCRLAKPDGTIRYMNSCVQCPKNYPWLGNPEGK